MNDLEYIDGLIKQNEFLTTEEERAHCYSALCAAINWGHKIDREQDAYNMAQKRKSIICRA